jgi:hypothetical protein
MKRLRRLYVFDLVQGLHVSSKLVVVSGFYCQIEYHFISYHMPTDFVDKGSIEFAGIHRDLFPISYCVRRVER